MNPKKIALALTVLALTATACGSGSKPTASSTNSGRPKVPAATIATGTAAAKAAAKASKQAAAVESQQAQETGTATPKGTPAPPPPPPGQASESDPPAPGTYTYKVDGSATSGGKTEKLPPEATQKFDPATLADGGAKRQVSHASGSDTTMLFTQDAVFIEQVVTNNYTCAMQPPLKLHPVPLQVGLSWTSKSSCQQTTTELSAKVLRTEKLTIGGVTIDTLVIDGTVNSTGAGFSQKQTQTVWYSPVYRLQVRQDVSMEVTFGTDKVTSKSVQELKSLTPAA